MTLLLYKLTQPRWKIKDLIPCAWSNDGMILKRNIKLLPVKHVPLLFYRPQIPRWPVWVRNHTSAMTAHTYFYQANKCTCLSVIVYSGLIWNLFFQKVCAIIISNFPRAVHWDSWWSLTLGQVFLQTLWSSPVGIVHDRPKYIVRPDVFSAVGETP